MNTNKEIKVTWFSKVQKFGRVVLPKEFRESHQIEHCDIVAFELTNDHKGLILTFTKSDSETKESDT